MDNQKSHHFLGDMTKQASVAQALQGIESVYLITPVTEHLLETEGLWVQEGKKAGLRHLVKQSEIGADDLLWTFQSMRIQGFPALIRLSVETSQARRTGRRSEEIP